MLQPYEQLRRGHEKPRRSITLDYTSLPPQAVVFRAIKNKHIGLAVVSLMTLLANVLSVALSGLFTESSVLIPQYAELTASHQFPLNGTSLGNGSISRNRPSYDSYYVASSNLTAGTPLPPWTDGQCTIRGIYTIVCQHNTTYNHNVRSQGVTALLPDATGDGWRYIEMDNT
jgi:hypothetical protein